MISLNTSQAWASWNRYNLPYAEKEMIEFFEKISPEKVTERTEKNSAAGWILATGVSINMMKVAGEKSIDQARKDYGTSVSPLLSIGYIFPVGRNFNSYFILPQVKVFGFKNTGTFNDGSFIRSTTFQAKLAIATEINGGVNVINSDNLQMHLSTGGGMLFLVNSKELSQQYSAATKALLFSSETKLNAMSYTLNVSAGLMLRKKILLSATYNISTPVANYISFTPKLSGVQLRLGYKLN